MLIIKKNISPALTKLAPSRLVEPPRDGKSSAPELEIGGGFLDS